MAANVVRSVYELLSNTYGVTLMIEDNPEVTEVGEFDVIIFKNNPRRIGLVVMNLSTNGIYVRPQMEASATAGIALVAGGGSLSMNCIEDFHLPALEWHAVASGGGSAIYSVGIVIV
jgi:hypothetical protein